MPAVMATVPVLKLEPRADPMLAMADWDLSNHHSQGPLLIRVIVTMMILVTIVMAMRMFTRIKLVGRFLVDDSLMLLAYIFFVFNNAATFLAVGNGMGNHIWTFDFSTIVPKLSKLVIINSVCVCLYATGLAFAKASIIALYLRIFEHNYIFKKIMWIVLFAVIGQWISIIILISYITKPLNMTTLLPKDLGNVNMRAFGYANAATTVATDIILCTFPLPIFWKLNMPVRERIIVCILFLLGGLASAASIIRLWGSTKMSNITDYTYNIVPSIYWNTAEVSLAIISPSITSLKPLFAKFWHSRIIYTRRSLTSPSGTTATTHSRISNIDRVGGGIEGKASVDTTVHEVLKPSGNALSQK